MNFTRSLKTFLLCLLVLFYSASNAQSRRSFKMQLPQDIIQPDINGDTFHVSSLKGKVVLVEFWASWCGPCRKESHVLKQAYEKFHDQNFEIVSISLDTDRDKWKNAIEKDGLNWIHVSDLRGWYNTVARQFDVNAIPFNLLLDREGNIIAYSLRGKELEKTLKRVL